MRKKMIMKRIGAMFVALAMTATLLLPSISAQAVAVTDSITLGEAALNAADDTLVYSNCVGYGSTVYQSIVISFTSVRTNDEHLELPTISGYTNEDTLSNDSTYVINMPEGKTLPAIASYIRKIKFVNCSKSTQTIKFTIGKNPVEYMTLFCEATGHYYQYVPFASAGASYQGLSTQSWSYGSWPYAYYKALDMTYEGLTGYLVTVSMDAEDAFLKKCAEKVGWMGGTRMARGTLKVHPNDSKLSYYDSFDPTSTTGTWIWADGPEIGTTLINGITYSSGYNSDVYQDWNTNEPNNSNGSGENCMTTLTIGTGLVTGYSSKVSKEEYLLTNYSWNDIVYNSFQNSDTGTDTYKSRGYFVEFGTTTDATNRETEGFTGFVFDSTTTPHTHTWENTTSSSDPATAIAYCTEDTPKCSYYGTAAIHANTFNVTLYASDMPQASTGSYTGASLPDGATYKKATGATISDITYYKVSTAGNTTDKSSPKTAAEVLSTVGYYYAAVTCTINDTTATLVAPFKIYDPNGATVSESLNNRMNSELQATSNITSSNDETKLNVILAAPTDDIALYKLATCTWNGSNLSDLTWVSTVSDWLTTGAGKTLYGDLAKTPATLSSQSNSTWSSFFNDLLVNTNHIDLTKLTDLVTNASDQYQTHTTYYKDASGNLVTDATTDDVANTKYQETFDEIELGIYAVVTPGYAVTVATIYPQETGPGVTYYIQNEYTVYLKEVQATIDKTINGLKEDTVGIGETEHFEVEFTLPTYKDAAFTYSSADDLTSVGYSLSFEDIMASGYTIDSDSLKIYYYYTDEEDDISFQQKVLIYDNDSATTNTNKTIPTASPKKFFKSTTTDTAVTGNDNVHVVTADDIGTEYADYTTDSSLVGAYAIPRSNVKIFDQVAITASTSASTNTTILINFDEPAVRQYIKDVKNADATKVIKGFVISYDATVNKNIKIASEDNKNTAYIHYEKSSIDKTLTEMHDTVYGYTYATSIVKIDGTASTDTSIKYLSGAKFKLYKEFASYIRTGSAGSYTYTYKGDVDMDETDPFIDTTNTDSDKVIAALQKDSSYYVYEMTATEAGTTNAYAIGSVLTSYNTNKNTNETALNDKLTLTSPANVSYSSGDVIVRVYKEVALEKIDSTITSMARDTDLKLDGVITSVATAGGVQVDGLDVGSYILTEVAAPTGYNDLAEDVYFEINKLTLLEEQSTTSKTLQQFREMPKTMTYDATDPTTAELNATADLELLVYNYKGLTLPSTGGIGIVIFVMIGCGMMAAVMILMVIRRRREREEY